MRWGQSAGQHRRAVGVIDRHRLALLARQGAPDGQRPQPELVAQLGVIVA
jgi:hypothetical protein